MGVIVVCRTTQEDSPVRLWVGAQQSQTGTLCGVPNQLLKPFAPENCWSNKLSLNVGRVSAGGRKAVIRAIDEEAFHTDPIKTQRLLNLLIDAPRNRKRYVSYSQSGSSCHVVYGIQEGPLLIKTFAVTSGGRGEDFLVLQYFTPRHIDLW